MSFHHEPRWVSSMDGFLRQIRHDREVHLKMQPGVIRKNQFITRTRELMLLDEYHFANSFAYATSKQQQDLAQLLNLKEFDQ